MTKNIKPIFIAIILGGIALYMVQNFGNITKAAKNSGGSFGKSAVKLKTANVNIIQLPRVEDLE